MNDQIKLCILKCSICRSVNNRQRKETLPQWELAAIYGPNGEEYVIVESKYRKKALIRSALNRTGIYKIFLAYFLRIIMLYLVIFLIILVDSDPTGHIRTLIFDIKYIRNLWAHQHIFTVRETYRAVEVINWFFEQLNYKVPDLEELRKILLKEMFFQVL